VPAHSFCWVLATVDNPQIFVWRGMKIHGVGLSLIRWLIAMHAQWLTANWNLKDFLVGCRHVRTVGALDRSADGRRLTWHERNIDLSVVGKGMIPYKIKKIILCIIPSVFS
jgi:hypothetical protein